MNDMMHDPNLPPAEEGVVENLVTPQTAKVVILELEFRPIKSGELSGEPVRKRKQFPTMAAAQEYMSNAMPAPPRQAYGSPKQALARRAKFLGVDPKWLEAHNLICHMSTERIPDAPSRRTRPDASESDGPTAGTLAPGGALVHSGPPPADLLRSIIDSEPLSEQETEFLEGGDDEAEDGGEVEGAETGLGEDED